MTNFVGLQKMFVSSQFHCTKRRARVISHLFGGKNLNGYPSWKDNRGFFFLWKTKVWWIVGLIWYILPISSKLYQEYRSLLRWLLWAIFTRILLFHIFFKCVFEIKIVQESIRSSKACNLFSNTLLHNHFNFKLMN